MLGVNKPRSTSNLQIVGVCAAVLAMWLGAVLMPTPTGKQPLTVAAGMWPGAETLILAREAGELPRAKVNLVEINWASAAMRAVGNRVVDATILSLDEVVRQSGQGYPLRIVLVTDVSRGAEAVMGRQGLTDVKQLKGLRVGYEPRTAASVLLDRCLRENGMQWADIQEVPVNPAEVEETFSDLMLDAVVLTEPWIHRMRGLNLNTLYSSKNPDAEVVRVLAVHEEAIRAHPDEVAAIVRAHLKWMPNLKTLQEPLEPVLRREGVSRTSFEEIVAKLEVPTLDQNVQWLTGDNPWLLERMAKLAAQLQLMNPVQQTKLVEMLDPTFVQQSK